MIEVKTRVDTPKDYSLETPLKGLVSVGKRNFILSLA